MNQGDSSSWRFNNSIIKELNIEGIKDPRNSLRNKQVDTNRKVESKKIKSELMKIQSQCNRKNKQDQNEEKMWRIFNNDDQTFVSNKEGGLKNREA